MQRLTIIDCLAVGVQAKFMKRLSAQQKAALVSFRLARGEKLGAMQIARLVGLKLRGTLAMMYKLRDVGLVERDPRTRKWKARGN